MVPMPVRYSPEELRKRNVQYNELKAHVEEEIAQLKERKRLWEEEEARKRRVADEMESERRGAGRRRRRERSGSIADRLKRGKGSGDKGCSVM